LTKPLHLYQVGYFAKNHILYPLEKAMRPMPQAPTLGYEKFKPLKPTILKREKKGVKTCL